MELLKLYWQRSVCWCKFVGREGYDPGFWFRIGPITAWGVACAIHPLEDINKWWLGTGWMGPGSHFYVGYFPASLEFYLFNTPGPQKAPGKEE